MHMNFQRKLKGAVKTYNKDRGFGFIADEAGREYFYHISQVSNQDVPKPGDKVKFDCVDTRKGFRATSVQKVNS